MNSLRSRTALRFGLCLGMLWACASNVWSQVAPPDSTSLSPKSIDAPNHSESQSDDEKFMRIAHDEEGTPTALQTAIVSYLLPEDRYPNTQIDLIGAVHVAHREYFQELNRRFRAYDVVLYELIAEPGTAIPEPDREGNVRHPIGAMQVGLKDMLGLEFQLDEINYQAKNFVHADMSPTEFAADMKNRGDGFVAMFSRMMGSSMAAQGAQAGKGQELKMLGALFSSNRKLKMRQAMADQFESMEIQLAGLSDASGRSTILTERNKKAFQVLDEQLKAGKKKIAIFYGAGHLTDMDERLRRDYSAVRGKTTWLTAWNLVE